MTPPVGGGWEVSGRAVHQCIQRPQADSSHGGARGMLGGPPPTTGTHLAGATVPTTSSPTVVTDWASIGQSATTTSRRTTTRSRCSSASCGSNEGMENTPNSPPGVLLPPAESARRLSCSRRAQRAATLGIPVIRFIARVLTRRQDADTIPAQAAPRQREGGQRILAKGNARERAACFWATECGRGCSIKANYQSPTVPSPAGTGDGKSRHRHQCHGAGDSRSMRAGRQTGRVLCRHGKRARSTR